MPTTVDLGQIKQRIVDMLRRGPSPLTYWTLTIIKQWVVDPRQSIPGNGIDKTRALTELLEKGIVTLEETEVVGRGKVRQAIFHNETAEANDFP